MACMDILKIRFRQEFKISFGNMPHEQISTHITIIGIDWYGLGYFRNGMVCRRFNHCPIIKDDDFLLLILGNTLRKG